MNKITISFLFYFDITTESSTFDIYDYEERLSDKCESRATSYMKDELRFIMKKNLLITEDIYKYMKIDSGIGDYGHISGADGYIDVSFEIELDEYIQSCIENESKDIKTIKNEIYKSFSESFSETNSEISVDDISCSSIDIDTSSVKTRIDYC